ncbi:hypothetical protein Q670_08730 [Alcanivorax sp. P2S70]|uniref:PEP-utilizing enzyme n=1 Tax=Alcanivorax sp. P2S70 TaxID=1397527 RepID=UPI0003B7AEB3|nr:PEP-utilizing enzyme [Alcanivorax sp. P2S70]ERP92809.1 hypothetical protein Q670_08730 [Alcanivorax sp. P2S70]
MSIEVLTADPEGEENLQQWASRGLPVPPSWRVPRAAITGIASETLVNTLKALPRMFGAERYWVLQQGPMNPDSRRESLLNLDSDEALAAALVSIFAREQSPEQVVIQALPRQQAAGVLFTRHPLRQDLHHVVVEGVSNGNVDRQRAIFDEQGRLVHASHDDAALHKVVGEANFHSLYIALKGSFDRPQAAEWVFDGEKIWLLQTLPVGSLPEPREAWTRRAGHALFHQAETPLWYTLAGRWLKTGFWEPLVEKKGWDHLKKVEPYRRQHSHIYTNCAYFRSLQNDHPGACDRVPPAWKALQPPAAPASPSLLLKRIAAFNLHRSISQWRMPEITRDTLWRAFMQLDTYGERLSGLEGALAYLHVPDRLAEVDTPLPLSLLLSGQELALIQALAEGDVEGVEESALRPGADPVHAALNEGPAQSKSVRAVPRTAAAVPMPSAREAVLFELSSQVRVLKFMLGNRFREVLSAMGALVVNQQLLQHPDDIHFLYFDELWQLWMGEGLPASASHQTLAQRKLRYLDDGLQGAPDWKMDQIGYGFGGGFQTSPLLKGLPLVPGQVQGPIRRLCSAWSLNRIQPGDILVMDQVDPSWTPWLLQAGGIVLAGKDPGNAAASLARHFGIPAIWAASDVMHSVRDEMAGMLDADDGQLDVAEVLSESD